MVILTVQVTWGKILAKHSLKFPGNWGKMRITVGSYTLRKKYTNLRWKKAFLSIQHKWMLDPFGGHWGYGRYPQMQLCRLCRIIHQNATDMTPWVLRGDLAPGPIGAGQGTQVLPRGASNFESNAVLMGKGRWILHIKLQVAEWINLLELLQLCLANSMISLVAEVVLSHSHCLLLLLKAKKSSHQHRGGLLTFLLVRAVGMSPADQKSDLLRIN